MSQQTHLTHVLPSGVPPQEWRSPGDALSRFTPPAGMILGATEKRTQERVRYGFRVGEIGLLIQPNAGSEAMPMPSIFPIPNTSSWLCGMINLRGNLVPIFDLAVLFAMPKREDRQTFVLVFGKEIEAVGMVVDSLPQALTGLRRLNNLPPLPAALEKCVRAGYDSNAGMWLEFDHEALFQSLASPAA